MNTIMNELKDLNKVIRPLATLMAMHQQAAVVSERNKENIVRRINLLEDIALGLPVDMLATFLRKAKRQGLSLLTANEIKSVYGLESFDYTKKLSTALELSSKALV